MSSLHYFVHTKGKDMEYKVGDKLGMYEDHHRSFEYPKNYQIVTVEKVTKTSVTVDGSRFTLRGEEWGNSTAIGRSALRLCTYDECMRGIQEDARLGKRRKDRARFTNMLEAHIMAFIRENAEICRDESLVKIAAQLHAAEIMYKLHEKVIYRLPDDTPQASSIYPSGSQDR